MKKALNSARRKRNAEKEERGNMAGRNLRIPAKGLYPA